MQQRWEAACIRAYKDTERFRKTSGKWFWGVEVVGSSLLAAVAAYFAFSNLKNWQVAVLTFLVFAVGLIVIYGIVYFVNLLRAPYLQRNELRRMINEQENKPKAKIVASKPTAGIGNARDLERNIDVKNIYAAEVKFYNSSLQVSASNVWATIRYYDSKEENEIGFQVASWEETGDKDTFLKYEGDTREIELKPNGPTYTIVLAIKHIEDDVCYAYSRKLYNYKDLRHPDYKLVGHRFVIIVSLRGQNVDYDVVGEDKEFVYILHNRGKGQGLAIEPYPEINGNATI